MDKAEEVAAGLVSQFGSNPFQNLGKVHIFKNNTNENTGLHYPN